jgi:hypothetical protein
VRATLEKAIMTDEEQTLLMIKGQIASLPEDAQSDIKYAAMSIRTIIRSNGVNGLLAMALVGAELQQDQTIS